MRFDNLPLLLLLLILPILPTATSSEFQLPPTTFGFMTVTHTRGNDYTQIQKHIHHYATLDCPVATELNIVWNNQIQPESSPIKLQRNKWKRPVNFHKTPSNSMDWRYKVPKESRELVFFNVDDDVVVDCEELKRGFKIWRENAVGSIGPIVTYAVRFFEYTQDHGFKYGMKKEERMFSLGLVGVAFLSRHFMDLYYAPIELLEEMRKIVREKNNCDDIGINWLIQYFYPELETIYVLAKRENLLAGSPAIAQSTSPTHYPYRSQCILDFTNLFGVNAVRYKPLVDKGRPEIRIKPLRETTVTAKWKYLEAIIKGEKPSLPEKSLEEPKKQPVEQKVVKEVHSPTTKQEPAQKPLQKQQGDKGEEGEVKKVVHNMPWIEVLLAGVIILLLIVSCLIYKLIGLTHENKFLHLRGGQTNAIEAASFDSSE